MFNVITAIGHLAADPIHRTTQTGKSVCKFRICISDKQAKATLFVDVDTWDKTADVCSQYLAKGRLVSVSGELCDNSYTDKEGNKRSSVCINATKVKFLSSGEKEGGKPQGQAGRPATPPADADFDSNQDDDDVPF